jgi:uncharacterized protein (DUF1501 family)
VADLGMRGILESTIVYCVGEFGRTPRVNQSAGRDHWARSMTAFLAGGGLRAGYAHGSTNRTWDGIIVTHSSFERIGMSRDYQEKFLTEQTFRRSS